MTRADKNEKGPPKTHCLYHERGNRGAWHLPDEFKKPRVWRPVDGGEKKKTGKVRGPRSGADF